jgi:hypothetical protein
VQYCEIGLDDDSFEASQVIRYEKQMLAFQAKCGWKKAGRLLEKLKADPEQHVLRHVNLGEGLVTVARHRELLVVRQEKATREALESVVEVAVEDADETVEFLEQFTEVEDENEFGGIADYIGADDGGQQTEEEVGGSNPPAP